MKKIIIVMLSFTLALIAFQTFGKDKTKDANSENNVAKKTENIQNRSSQRIYPSAKKMNIGKLNSTMPGLHHSKRNVDCKNCHECEYPTKKDPCLIRCPKTSVSVYHSPDEAPEAFALDKLSDRYGEVVFSHKIHAQMSEMSHGCSRCHHYNTTGPVLSCKKCHEQKRLRTDISKPDLEAAYHRQCMNCHRQWSRTTDCNSCHLPKGKPGEEKKQMVLKQTLGKKHPEVPKPNKVVYETKSDKGKYVTFYHNEHIDVFKIPCTSCHKEENCAKCHDPITVAANTKNPDRNKKVHKSFEEHHKPCISCHDSKNCAKCHSDKPMEPFNHEVTAKWKLKSYHSKLDCERCHVVKPFTKMGSDCNGCHRNFASGKFDHKVVGLSMTEEHKDLECVNCHDTKNYSKSPKCIDCHDDKSFPKDMPGKDQGGDEAVNLGIVSQINGDKT